VDSSSCVWSGRQGLTGAIAHSLQVCTAVLAWIEALAVLGNARMIDDGEAEAAFAGGHDSAIKWRKGAGEGANGILNLVLSIHLFGVPKTACASLR
jgi:hypothetical protein